MRSKQATTAADQDVAQTVAKRKDDAKEASHCGRRPGSAKSQGATAVAGALPPADTLPDACGLGRAQWQEAVDLAGTSEATAVAQHVALIFSPPARLYFVDHTKKHLEQRGFRCVKWLRTPDAHEMAYLDQAERGERRVMILWYMTVFPTVRCLAEKHGCRGVFLFEDTCLLAEGVCYTRVANEVRDCDAGVFAYGSYKELEEGAIKWHGVKGLYLTPEWCERQQVIFENMHVSRFWHIDNWLAERRSSGEEPDFQLLTPLGGYGHRMSQTQAKESCFGGAWLPAPPDEPAQ